MTNLRCWIGLGVLGLALAPAVFAQGLTITTEFLPDGTVGEQYSTIVSTSGSAESTAWGVSSGQLPPGLNIAPSGSNGVISGTPTQAGEFTFTIRVTDSQGQTATKSFTITVFDPLSITTPPSLPDGAVGSPYLQALAAAGGQPPYEWRVVEGELPLGLSLSESGVISGTPQEEGTFDFQVYVLDSSERFASEVFRLVIDPPIPLTVITTSPLRTAVVGESYRQEFEAEGGLPPYLWTINPGPPPGLSFTSDGVLQGRPTQEGVFRFTVTVVDSQETTASREFTLTVAVPLAIETESPLPDATLGVAYSVQLVAVGGEPPYSWSRLPGGGTLPRGLFLTNRGQLTGTPEEEGTFPYGVVVTDQRGRRASKQFVLTVGPPEPQITITTESPLPPATLGAPYSVTFAADGAPPYQWSLAEGFSAPPGLSLSAAGVLSGTPSEPGEFSFGIRVVDAEEASATKMFELVVERPSLEITTASPLPDGVVNQTYFQSLSAEGGEPPYTWSLVSGNLPPGIALDPAGSLDGAPSEPGEFDFRLRVADTGEESAERDFRIRITRPPLVILTAASLPVASVGAAYEAALEAGGGQPPYTWTIASGSLPEGLSLIADGSITGTPGAPGDFTFGATVTDSAEESATRQFTLSVQTSPLSAVTIGGLPAQVEPRQQPNIEITLAEPYPVALTGVARLTFTSDTTPAVDNPEVQFAGGGRTASFTIPAGAAAAQFGDAESLGLQTGSVAGRIVVTLEFLAGGADITPDPPPQQEVIVVRAAPSITSVVAEPAGGGFQVIVVGISSPRDMTQATFRFTARPGSNLQTTELTVNVNSAFTTWYQSEESANFGSAFRYVQPFSLQGDLNAVASVSVTLTNSAGSSQPASDPLP